ncbi:Branched-chain amino acid transport ATP-binding protein LivG (TC 3.A.1.4.1) [hydrothermal vent metagenome]|jgi:ABC-type branched-subunit amino acid transport system ATPase component|uniref:Branched-chain amino acid transport ATP-binding protein LivG (TC 3.A.1.4.1) n=1 Tax=hydrothermal vent metagenome TaxID=652676 RepID=A0A160TTI1_9ZZZZ|nr:ABC transporter ATP-binding protein [Gammaproteobacteria bacterium]MEC8870187.1 ABC transporter ATP-binding protein [Pseudomonadota bacterium]|tara:strand:- start:2213 stop:2959 length:747 start_codon:yes stop_codon:yes gene_type:complete
MLEIKTLSKHFGGVKAVDNLDLQVERGEIVGLIGPNGSGKSTLVNLVCGVLKPTSGEVIFEGHSMAGQVPSARLRHGIARTFQNIRLFGGLTVWQNLWVARNSNEDIRSQSILRRWLGSATTLKKEIETMLEFSDLADKADVLASNLAFGEQRRLELARAVAAKPRLLLLDEPAAGMNRAEVAELEQRIRSLREQGITILLVEHVMQLVMGVTDRIAVLNFGSKIAEGSPNDIQENTAVQEAYLGRSD